MVFFATVFFTKVPHIKFHGNPSNGSRADTCERTDGLADMNESNSRVFATVRKRVKVNTDDTVISHDYLASFVGRDKEQNWFRCHSELQTYKRDHSLNAEYTGCPRNPVQYFGI